MATSKEEWIELLLKDKAAFKKEKDGKELDLSESELSLSDLSDIDLSDIDFQEQALPNLQL